jgi:hypothetical protein
MFPEERDRWSLLEYNVIHGLTVGGSHYVSMLEIAIASSCPIYSLLYYRHHIPRKNNDEYACERIWYKACCKNFKKYLEDDVKSYHKAIVRTMKNLIKHHRVRKLYSIANSLQNIFKSNKLQVFRTSRSHKVSEHTLIGTSVFSAQTFA